MEKDKKKASEGKICVINNCLLLLRKIMKSNIDVDLAKYLDEKINKKTFQINDLFEDIRFVLYFSIRYDFLNKSQNNLIKNFLNYYDQNFKSSNSSWRKYNDVDDYYNKKLKKAA